MVPIRPTLFSIQYALVKVKSWHSRLKRRQGAHLKGNIPRSSPALHLFLITAILFVMRNFPLLFFPIGQIKGMGVDINKYKLPIAA